MQQKQLTELGEPYEPRSGDEGEWYDAALLMVEETLQGGEEVDPMVVVDGEKDGERTHALTPLFMEKRHWREAIKRTIDKVNGTGIIFLSSTWISPPEQGPEGEMMRPKDNPERRHAVVAQIKTDDDGYTETFVLEYHPTEDGEPRNIEDWHRLPNELEFANRHLDGLLE